MRAWLRVDHRFEFFYGNGVGERLDSTLTSFGQAVQFERACPIGVGELREVKRAVHR